LERDLHDGVQNQLVLLIVALALAQREPDTPAALAEMLAGLEARAQDALDSVRDIARGIYPRLLADFGLGQALRALATHAPATVSVEGSARRSSEEAEEAVYFACSEAIQNAAKHAGRPARVTLWISQTSGTLAVRIADDGRGFDPTRTPDGAGLQNIRDRVRHLHGSFRVTSAPGLGTALTISVPWPARRRSGARTARHDRARDGRSPDDRLAHYRQRLHHLGQLFADSPLIRLRDKRRWAK
jgi:signal transduction histidine kinase